MDQWINGQMDQWTNGPMDEWINGPMIQWTNGPMDIYICHSLVTLVTSMALRLLKLFRVTLVTSIALMD